MTRPTHIIRRADGEDVYGEWSFMACDGPDDWEVAENVDHDDDTTYEILACTPVAERKILATTLCRLCDGEGIDGDGDCPDCNGSGEVEPPEARSLVPVPSSVTDEEAAERMVSKQVAADVAWMAKLARGSSWPGEMAQRVDDAAARVLDALEGR